MHMADALLSPAVGGVMTAISVGTLGYSAYKVKKDDLDEKKVPIMGVMGAFVFAAQMINFTIPGTGSSGHIGGGIMLAALLGQYPAFLTIAAVLIIQALFFADGGLLALGCNIFNMGFFSCFVAYPLIFKPILKKGINTKNITIAAVLSTIIGLQFGAFSVVLETLASGITELPFKTFVALMQPIHLAIGLVEGIITAAVVTFVYKMRPELLENSVSGKAMRDISMKKVLSVMAVLVVVVGCVLSLFASAYPDGLEWSMEGVSGTAELEASGGIYDSLSALQEKLAFLPDYSFKSDEDGSNLGTATSGIVGAILTLGLAGIVGVSISAIKKKKKDK